MELKLLSPLKRQQFEIVWLEINTAVGNFVIQKAHAPMIVTLARHEKLTFCLANGKRESIIIEHGVAHITRTDATILLSQL